MKKQMATVATGQFANLEELIDYKMARAEKVLRRAKILQD
jgi:hypothetical protein